MRLWESTGNNWKIWETIGNYWELKETIGNYEKLLETVRNYGTAGQQVMLHIYQVEGVISRKLWGALNIGI